MKNHTAQLADAFKTLGDENRIRIIEMLTEGEKTGSELLSQLSLSQPTLSHHMKLLCDASLVTMRKSGKWVYYSLSQKELADLSKVIDGYIGAALEARHLLTQSTKAERQEKKLPKAARKSNQTGDEQGSINKGQENMPTWLF